MARFVLFALFVHALVWAAFQQAPAFARRAFFGLASTGNLVCAAALVAVLVLSATLARRRAVVGGLGAGLAIGVLTVGAWLALRVFPKEVRTARTLLETRERLEAERRRVGTYPPPDRDGNLRFEVGPVEDAFGNALGYRLVQRWQIASYRIVSLGADRVPSDDDLCIDGGNQPAVRFADAGKLEALNAGAAPDASWARRFAMLRALRCPDAAVVRRRSPESASSPAPSDSGRGR